MPLVKHKISLKNIQMALGEITCNEISVQQATHPPFFSFTMLAYLLFLFDQKSNSDIFLISFDFITLYGKTLYYRRTCWGQDTNVSVNLVKHGDKLSQRVQHSFVMGF